MRAFAHVSAAWRRGRLPALLGLVLFGLGYLGGEPPETGAKGRAVDLGGGVKMALVLIPAGSFTMGSTEAEIKAVLAKFPDCREEFIADEKPAHKVTISKAFHMGKHAVTVGQFRRFVEATGYKTDARERHRVQRRHSSSPRERPRWPRTRVGGTPTSSRPTTIRSSA